jgi:hypothetical protein
MVGHGLNLNLEIHWMICSELGYLYRDGGNYKFRSTLLIAGKLDIEDIRCHLFDGQYFVPERVGIPSLVPNSKNGDDHLLHEIEFITTIDSTQASLDVSTLLNRFANAASRGWFDA